MKSSHIFKPISVFLLLTIALISCGQSKDKASNTIMQNDSFPIQKSEADWKNKLTESQYYILRQKGTESAGSGKFYLHKEKGIYTCGGCGEPLFDDKMKFESHCGWPSFDREIAGGKIKQIEDNDHGMSRTEIVCAKCGGHLGHIFNDGPTSTGMRYCVNSESLGFESESQAKITKMEKPIDTITLGGGCFWCMEAVFQEMKGVIAVSSGYSGGNVKNATYSQVSKGNTGHAEVIQIIYKSSEVSLYDILKVFFTVHDPTTMNRQGADEGTQYRSAIFYRDENQKMMADKVVKGVTEEKLYENPIVTEVKQFSTFIKAEDYHQNYFKMNQNQPYCRAVVQPKVEKFEKLFKSLIKK